MDFTLTKREKNKITVVIPAYNEEKTIGEIIRKVKKYTKKILVVISKNSNDATLKIVKSLGIPYIIDDGKGKGAALRLAIDHLNEVKEEIVLFIDADGSHEPADIPKLVLPILNDRADMVVGSRMLGGSEEMYGTISEFFRLFASCIITLIINYRFGVRLTDYQNGFRAIKLKAAKNLDLKEDITTIEQEMGIKCLKKGYRVIEVPTHEYKRKFGHSVISLRKHGWRYLLCLMKNII